MYKQCICKLFISMEYITLYMYNVHIYFYINCMHIYNQKCTTDACKLRGMIFQRLPMVFHLRLIQGAADWVRIHGHTPLCSVPGFTPWRGLVHKLVRGNKEPIYFKLGLLLGNHLIILISTKRCKRL